MFEAGESLVAENFALLRKKSGFERPESLGQGEGKSNTFWRLANAWNAASLSEENHRKLEHAGTVKPASLMHCCITHAVLVIRVRFGLQK